MADTTKREEVRRIDFPSMFRDIFKRLLILILCAAVAGVGAYIFVDATYVPQYVAGTTFVVSVRGSSASAYTNLATASSMAAAFSEIIDSKVMTEMINTGLSLNGSEYTLESAAAEGTNIVELKVTANDPVVAYNVARAVYDNHRVIISDIMENVNVQILMDPTVPYVPSNAKGLYTKTRNAAVVGFLAAFVLFAFLSYTKGTVKNQQEFQREIDAKLIGSVFHEKVNKTFKSRIKRRKKSILLTDPSTSFGYVETFRRIRTKLEYAGEKTNDQVIVVTSVLENEGKSTVASNIAQAFALKGKRTLLLDADLRRPAIYKVFDLKQPTVGLNELFFGTKADEHIIVDEKSGLNLLCTRNISADEIASIKASEISGLFKYLKEEFDYIIVDTSPLSVGADSESFVNVADAVLLVVRQNEAKIRSINDAIDIFSKSQANFYGCIFNNVHGVGFTVGKYGYGKYGRYGYGKYGTYPYGYGYGYGYNREQEKSHEKWDEEEGEK